MPDAVPSLSWRVEVGVPGDTRRGLMLHELLLLGLGLLLSWWLGLRAGPGAPLFWETAVASIAFATVVRLAPRARRGPALRIVGALLYTWWMYLAMRRLVPALGLHPQDALLARIDRLLCGGRLPAVAVREWARPDRTELLSLCYLSYQLFLHGALFAALWAGPVRALQLGHRLFTAFALGLIGYLLVPARGPLFAAGLAPLEGYAISACNSALVAHGSGMFDVFPSLHLLISLVLLADARERRRGWLLAAVLPGIALSTVYLGYHYLIDLIAALVLFLILRYTPLWRFRCP